MDNINESSQGIDNLKRKNIKKGSPGDKNWL
mgnify:CR=1 FL=1